MTEQHVSIPVVGGVAALPSAVSRVCAVVVRFGVPPRRVDDVRLAVHELVLNAFEHGHRGDERIPIDVEVSGSPTQVRVRVVDRGVGHGWASGRVADGQIGVPGDGDDVRDSLRASMDSERGRGLQLVAGVVDHLDVDVSEGRTAVTVMLDVPRMMLGPR